MTTKNKLFLIVALFYTLYIIFPLFADIMRLPVWLPSLASTIVMFILYPRAFQNKIFYWFLVYALVLAFFLSVGKPLTIGIGTIQDNKKILIEFAYILPSISIFSILRHLNNYKITQKYVYWSVAFLYVSFIIAVPLMQRYSSLREAMAEQENSIDIPGLPGYSLMHAYTLFAPPLCYGLRYANKKIRLISIVALAILSLVIISTYVTTSLIVLLGIIIFTILYSSKRTLLFWGVMSLIALILYICYEDGLFVDFIDWIKPWFSDTAVEQKLDDFRASMVEGQLTGGTITVRQNLHDISWNSFFENPLWGTSVVGGHSAIIDRLGGLGLMGALPFLMIIITFTIHAKKMLFTKESRSFFILGIVASFLYLYEKGLWGAESWLIMMVMTPMAICVLEKSLISSKSIKN